MKVPVIISALLLSFAAHASPSPDAVKSVVDYYFADQPEGPVLADVKLCDSVVEQGENKNDCSGEHDPANLVEGQPLLLWMMFMVPAKLQPQDVMVQLNYKGVTMAVQNAHISTSMRYRVWRKVNLDRPGDWTIKIVHDDGQQMQVMKEMTLHVQPKSAANQPNTTTN